MRLACDLAWDFAWCDTVAPIAGIVATDKSPAAIHDSIFFPIMAAPLAARAGQSCSGAQHGDAEVRDTHPGSLSGAWGGVSRMYGSPRANTARALLVYRTDPVLGMNGQASLFLPLPQAPQLGG